MPVSVPLSGLLSHPQIGYDPREWAATKSNIERRKSKMSLLVTGSIGIDTVESPAGKAVDALGGSSVYFAQAASFFSPVRFVGVVGEDCPPDFLKPLADNPAIDMAGLEVRAGAKTFRWHGRYHEDVNERDTINVELNVLGERGPTIPEAFRDSRYVFLANTHPALQLELLGQMADPALVVADTMDLWIDGERETLMELLSKIDGLVLNDAEARQLTGKTNVVAAGVEIAGMLKRFVVVKKGEHGALLFADGEVLALPSYPCANVIDPTGAGDSFAGGMMSHLAAVDDVSMTSLKKALAAGTIVASFTLEDFSLNRLQRTGRDEINERLANFEEMLRI